MISWLKEIVSDWAVAKEDRTVRLIIIVHVVLIVAVLLGWQGFHPAWAGTWGPGTF